MTKLEIVGGDWGSHLKQKKEDTIEKIAAEIARKHPTVFSDKLIGDKRDDAEKLIRSVVFANEEMTITEKEEAIRAIMGQATGYGALEEFFTGEDSTEITEIMVNSSADGRPKVFIGKGGRQHPVNKVIFGDNTQLANYLRKICEDAGRPFTEDSPIIDAWLSDGSRVAVCGYKAAPVGATLTIRKSPLIRPPLPMKKLVEYKMFPEFADHLFKDLLVGGAANLAVCGRTDSGKTAVLRALGLYINPKDRTLVAETSFELSLPHLPNCVNMVTVSMGGKEIVSMSDLCASFNRHNPDRTIVGEIRGGEIVDAANIAESTSGGFWTTLHAGDVDAVRARFPKMFRDGGATLEPGDVDAQIRTMFHFMLFVDKAWDNTRTFIELVEVTKEEYRTIIELDKKKFVASKGKTRQWIYKNAITEERLNALGFRGAEIKPEYKKIHQVVLAGHRPHA